MTRPRPEAPGGAAGGITTARPRLLVATRSRHKLGELRDLVRPANAQLISLDEAGIPDEADETGEASEVFATGGPVRVTAPPKQNPFAPVEGAERHIPSTTGKLSDDTLKELLLAQEHEQDSAPAVGAAAQGWKE